LNLPGQRRDLGSETRRGIQAVSACMGYANTNPGRAVAAARIVYETRVRLADLVGVTEPAHLPRPGAPTPFTSPSVAYWPPGPAG